MAKKISIDQLRDFWNRHAIGNPGELSTAGVRKLVLACFGINNTEEWKEKARGYDGKPQYPFWIQAVAIQDQIIAILRTHPQGKEIIEKISRQLFFEHLRAMTGRVQ